MGQTSGSSVVPRTSENPNPVINLTLFFMYKNIVSECFFQRN